MLKKLHRFYREWDRLHKSLGVAEASVASIRQQGNPGKQSSRSARRSRTQAIPEGLRDQGLARDGGRCVLCGRTASDGVKWQVDHIVPRSQGGDDALDNLQTLCAPCNRGKSNRDHHTWRRS